MSEQQWYYAMNGQQAGPVSWEELLTELRMGRIQPSTQVWSAHLPGWTPLAECLKAQGGPPPLPPPSPAPTPFPASIQRPTQGLLPLAPGATTAKTTGILSLIFAFLCLPVGIVLAIVALVQHSKAKTAYSLSPGSYQPVSSVGRTTAIIGLVLPVLLFFIGLVSAIAIPALLGQRGRARDKASIATMTSAIADLMEPKLLVPDTPKTRPVVRQKLRQIMESVLPQTIEHTLAALRDRPDSTGRLISITVPTLILIGHQDAITPLSVAQSMQQAILNAQLSIIPAAGHMPPMEQPEAFNRIVRDFLAGL